MNGIVTVSNADELPEHGITAQGFATVLGRGSFLGHGFRVSRGVSRDEVRVEVYSRDRWWVMARVSGGSGTEYTFVWDRAWLRVGRPWRDGVESAVSEILVGVRDAV